MGLAQDIVIVSSYTTPTPSGGSRGGSPGAYVTRYMARPQATEPLYPVTGTQIEDYTLLYMARANATEQMKADPDGSARLLTHQMRKQTGLDGRAFGSRGISLSEDDLRATSKEIQDAFDEGHAVQKMVLSFTEDYLKSTDVLDDDFVYNGRGSYRGQVDQLKLRRAINKGVSEYTDKADFIDPVWVGTVQIDTAHIHCHLAITDKEFSPDRMKDDGHDRGKIYKKEQAILRRSLHHELIDMQPLYSYHQATTMHRQNTTSYVKDYTRDKLAMNTQLQLLVASLPNDQRMWRYGSNAKEMVRPNEIATSYIQSVFEKQPNASGYDEAMWGLNQYADQKQKDDNLSVRERLDLIKNGTKRLIEQGVNGVYKTIKEKVRDKDRDVHTPMITIQSASDEELQANRTQDSNEFEQSGFELRMRGYRRRNQKHQDGVSVYRSYIDDFNDALDDDNVGSDAFIMQQFYEHELLYNLKALDKYRSFFKFYHTEDVESLDEMLDRYYQVQEAYENHEQFGMFLDDVDSGDIYDKLDLDKDGNIYDTVTETNQKIKDAYGVDMGARAFVPGLRYVVADEYQESGIAYAKLLRTYTLDAAEKGLATSREFEALLPDDKSDDEVIYHTNMIPPAYPQGRIDGIDDDLFNQVKNVDIHHLSVDFYGSIDVNVGKGNAEAFSAFQQQRLVKYSGAMDYLNRTGQDTTRFRGVGIDLRDARQTIRHLEETGTIRPAVVDIDEIPTARYVDTIALDDELQAINDIQRAVRIIDDFEDELERD